MKAIKLRTEHLENPLGIDVTKPYLSWICDGGITQTSYEISAFSNGIEVWNNKVVKSEAMHTYYEGELKSRQRIEWKIRLYDEEGIFGEWSETASFEMGLLNEDDYKAKWINPELNTDIEVNSNIHKPASYLKKEFIFNKASMSSQTSMSSQASLARLYITCHGVYIAYLNGIRVGDFILAPGAGTYDKKLTYQTLDVTELIKDVKNELLVILGDGWYRGCTGVDGDRNLFGSDISLYCQLEVNGEVICISDESWLASNAGPIRENDMQQGETYDALREGILVNTSKNNENSSNENSSNNDSSNNDNSNINYKDELSIWHSVKLEDFGINNLVCSNSVPIKEHESFEGKIITTPNGETVIDFGQNLAGYVEFTVSAHAGDKLTLWHGEALDENGNFTNENFQPGERHKEGGIQQKITYICKEGINHYKPSFTIMGYQYVKVETNISLKDAKFISHAVYSKMDVTSRFTCSNKDLEKLVLNSIWSQKSNFLDIPTDCPTRERAGWTGDAGIFVDTGLYLMDSYPVFRKWLNECRLVQYQDGRVRNIAPPNARDGMMTGILAGSVGWGDASIIVPYTLYKRYGDIRILEENYDMMQKWHKYLEGRAKSADSKDSSINKKSFVNKNNIDTSSLDLKSIDMSSIDMKSIDLSSIDMSSMDLSKIDLSKFGLNLNASSENSNEENPYKENPYIDYTIDSGFDYGEWCEPGATINDSARFTRQSVATAYLSYSSKLLSEIADILGKTQDAKYYKEVSDMAKKAFRYTYTKEGKISGERQCEYVRAIAFGLLDDEDSKQAAKDLNELVIKNDYHLNTGFLSTPFLCEVLVEYGYIETAYKLLLQETSPSWLYAVKKGANTIWEKWDGINEDGIVSASLNHYSYGVISGWLIKGVCGIALNDGKLTITPKPFKLLEYAKAEYDSPVGKIVSGWKYEDNKLLFEFDIPSNVTAEVKLSDGRNISLISGHYVILR